MLHHKMHIAKNISNSIKTTRERTAHSFCIYPIIKEIFKNELQTKYHESTSKKGHTSAPQKGQKLSLCPPLKEISQGISSLLNGVYRTRTDHLNNAIVALYQMS